MPRKTRRWRRRINQRALATNRGEEVVDDLVLLDRHGVEENLLEAANAALLHEAAELGHRDPFVLVVAPAPVYIDQ